MDGKPPPPISPSKPPSRLQVHVAANALFFLLFFLSCLLLLPLSTAKITAFDYADFTNSSGICLKGNASLDSAGAIQLTFNDWDDYSVGRAYYCHQIHLWNSETNDLTNFTSTFTFGVSSGSDDILGGGVAFFLSENPNIPLSGDGDHLGLASSLTASSSSRFVAVEFDSWQNDWDPVGGDCHVGIDVNSIESVASKNMVGDEFSVGPRGKARVIYDSITKNLSVSLDYNDSLYQLFHIVDLRQSLPPWVYVGFSLSVDDSSDPKNISSWRFECTDLDATQESPPTSSPTSLGPIEANSDNGRSSKKYIVFVVGISVPLFVILLAMACFAILTYRRRQALREIEGVMASQPQIPVKNIQSLPRENVVYNHPIDPTANHNFYPNALTSRKTEEGPRSIPFMHLVAATENFNEQRKLGKGGFGAVYHGFMKDLNRHVAIKRIAEDSNQGEKEFLAEVKIISRLRHRNLVQLIGWCREDLELLLVYEFLPNGSLDTHLFDADWVLPWPRRYGIALGVASALQYLHEGCDECIVHRDIKPSNIMLDGNFIAKLGDFGLARTTNHGSTLPSTMMAGTVGYVAPECFNTGKASKESDAYSFGIVALEIACGRRAVDPQEKGKGKGMLIRWMSDLYEKEKIMDAADAKLRGEYDERQMERLMLVGLWCAHPEAGSRPSFRQSSDLPVASTAHTIIQRIIHGKFEQPNVIMPTPSSSGEAAACSVPCI